MASRYAKELAGADQFPIQRVASLRFSRMTPNDIPPKRLGLAVGPARGQLPEISCSGCTYNDVGSRESRINPRWNVIEERHFDGSKYPGGDAAVQSDVILSR